MSGKLPSKRLRDARRAAQRPERWAFIPELSPASLGVTATTILALVQRGPQWVHRRVETLTFVDETVVRRHLSVDFTLPKHLPTPLRTPDGSPVYFVPLTFLRREAGPMRFDVRDEGQRALPLLTEREHDRLGAAMLYQLAAATLPRDLRKIKDDALAGALTYLPFRAYEDALPLLRAILNPESRDWKELAAGEAARHRLRNDPHFANFISLVAGNSIAVAPLVGPPGQRRVIKLSFEEDLAARRDVAEHVGLRSRAAIAAGWSARVASLDAPLIGSAETQHVQITAPSSVEITGAGLTGDSPRNAIRDRVHGPRARFIENPDRGEDPTYLEVEPGFASRAHLYVAGSHGLATGMIWVGFRAQRRGWLIGAFTASLFIALALGASALLDDTLVDQPSSATSLLLLVPGLAAAYLVRPGEHQLASRLLRFPRLLLAVSALCSFAAAGALLALGPTGSDPGNLTGKVTYPNFAGTVQPREVASSPTLFWTLVALTTVATLTCLLLALSVVRPRPQSDR